MSRVCISSHIYRVVESFRKEHLKGATRVTGYKVIPAKNVPSKTEGIGPLDIKGAFSQGVGTDSKFYLTSSLNGAKMYAYYYYGKDRAKRRWNEEYSRYVKYMKKDYPGEEIESPEAYINKNFDVSRKMPKRLAILKVELMSKSTKPKKDFTETMFLGTGDQYWVDHKDIVPGSMKFKVVGYISEDDNKDIEDFEAESSYRRPHHYSEKKDK